MASEVSAGSQTAVISTEHTLDTQTSIGTYVLKVNVSNMVDGDVLELRVKTKARNADAAAEVEYLATFANAQPVAVVSSVPVLSSNTVFTLKQTAGTGRAYTWSVNSV